MAGERITRRQKDISRLQRERSRRLHGDYRKPSSLEHGKGGRIAPPFSRRQIRELEAHGLSLEEAFRQITLLRRGVPFVHLERPCRMGDGIRLVPPSEFARLTAYHSEAAKEGRMMKFVPASGAATRMFQEWFRFLSGQETQCPGAAEWERFPFFPYVQDLMEEKGINLDLTSTDPEVTRELLRLILTEEGLDYGNLPKALLPFHRYGEEIRTALEEHLVEAAYYIRDEWARCRIHVTIGGEHEERLRTFLATRQQKYEERFGVTYEVTFSTQDASTDTIALDARGHLALDVHGRLLFRPGGHGALLKNLNDLRGDILFIRNIDNVVREERLAENVLWHQVMGGLLVAMEREVHTLLRELAAGKTAHAEEYVQNVLGISIPTAHDLGSESEKRHFLYERLHRPLRVCGMVRNEGEPGGGPFWVRERTGELSLQIVEEIQVDHQSPTQMAIWREATHFNPVDLVCSLRDEEGNNYDLTRYADPQTAIITHKTDRGRPITALEHPGLWNGGMARWNTIFIEIPLTLFNPVKTCLDLLRPSHQPG